jgi:hypothetical protein
MYNTIDLASYISLSTRTSFKSVRHEKIYAVIRFKPPSPYIWSRQSVELATRFPSSVIDHGANQSPDSHSQRSTRGARAVGCGGGACRGSAVASTGRTEAAAGWAVELHIDPDHRDGNEPSFLSQAYFSIERCDFGISLMASRVEQWDDNQRLLQRKKAQGSNVSQLPPLQIGDLHAVVPTYCWRFVCEVVALSVTTCGSTASRLPAPLTAQGTLF